MNKADEQDNSQCGPQPPPYSSTFGGFGTAPVKAEGARVFIDPDDTYEKLACSLEEQVIWLQAHPFRNLWNWLKKNHDI